MRVVRVEGLGNPDHDGESPVERAVFGERPPKASMPRPIQDLVRVLLAAGNPWIRGADLVGRVRSANGDIYSTDQVLAIASRTPSILMVEGELIRIRTLRPDLADGIEARCVTCGQRFRLPATQLMWLEEHRYQLPRRCERCRRGGRPDDLRTEAVRARAEANATVLGKGLAERHRHGSAPTILSEWEPGEGPGTPGGCIHGLPYESCRSCRDRRHR